MVSLDHNISLVLCHVSLCIDGLISFAKKENKKTKHMVIVKGSVQAYYKCVCEAKLQPVRHAPLASYWLADTTSLPFLISIQAVLLVRRAERGSDRERFTYR